MHTYRDCNQASGRYIPQDDCSWQGDYVTDPLREVQQEEQVAEETAYQGGYIDPVAPRLCQPWHPVKTFVALPETIRFLEST
jgi:hypothetical protein